MQNKLTFASENFDVYRDNIQPKNVFLFISSAMSNTCSLSKFRVLFSDLSFLWISRKLFGQIGNLVGHDRWLTVISTTAVTSKKRFLLYFEKMIYIPTNLRSSKSWFSHLKDITWLCITFCCHYEMRENNHMHIQQQHQSTQ